MHVQFIVTCSQVIIADLFTGGRSACLILQTPDLFSKKSTYISILARQKTSTCQIATLYHKHVLKHVLCIQASLYLQIFRCCDSRMNTL